MASWALLHSLLATGASKRLATRLFGETRRDAGYRLAYNAVAAVSTAVLAAYLHRLPDREIYRIPERWRMVTASTRLALLLCCVAAATEIGIGPFSGISEMLAYLHRRRSFEAPEAQGPAMDSDGQLRTGGPFAYVRHPLNASATAIVFLTPRMTEVRLTVALATLVYSIVGSKLEEARLLRMYGPAYRRYMESGVPFLIPRLRSLPGQG